MNVSRYIEPLLIWPKELPSNSRFDNLSAWSGPDGPLAQFLEDLGPILLRKYSPKGIVIFSAHWESKERIGELGGQQCLVYEASVEAEADA